MRPARYCLAALCAALVTLTLAAPACLATVNHRFLGALAGENRIPKPPELLRDACGVAADSEGNRYLSDYYHAEVEIFNYDTKPSLSLSLLGERLGAAGDKGSITLHPATDAPCALAVDSAGRLYANLWHEGVVRYLPGAFPFPLQAVPSYGTALTIDPGPATGVAVDPSSDRLYVAHRTYVAVYEPDGSPVMDGPQALRIGAGGALADTYGVAVSGYGPTAARVYVADAADHTVKAFDPSLDADSPVQVIDGALTPQLGFSDLTDTSLAVDSADGHLLVVDRLDPAPEHPLAVVDEFAPDGSYLGQLPHVLIDGRSSGLAVDNSTTPTSGLVYATSGDEEESVLYGFCPTTPVDGGLHSLCPGSVATKRLQISLDGAGHGSVTSIPVPLSCGVLCAWEFPAGSAVSLLASPRPHSRFAGWTLSGGAPCPGTNACQVALNADTTVTASFEPIPQRTLEMTVTGAGEGAVSSRPAGIQCGAVCSAPFDQGTVVTLTAEAPPGSSFIGWSGGGCSGTGPCEVTLDADLALSADFLATPRPAFQPAAPAATPAAQAPPVPAITKRPNPRHHHHTHHHHRHAKRGGRR